MHQLPSSTQLSVLGYGDYIVVAATDRSCQVFSCVPTALFPFIMKPSGVFLLCFCCVRLLHHAQVYSVKHVSSYQSGMTKFVFWNYSVKAEASIVVNQKQQRNSLTSFLKGKAFISL